MTRKSKTVARRPDIGDAFFNAQGACEDTAMDIFNAALRRELPKLIQQAIAEVASHAFGNGVEWALQTPMTKAERKSIA